MLKFLACIWPWMRSVGADFNFICTHQYKEFLGSRESIEEFMHTDESSKRFRAQLTGRGPSQTSLCNYDITTLYHRHSFLLPYMPRLAWTCLQKCLC